MIFRKGGADTLKANSGHTISLTSNIIFLWGKQGGHTMFMRPLVNARYIENKPKCKILDENFILV